MSYDFCLVPAGEGDPAPRAREWLRESETGELNPGARDPAKEERKEALAWTVGELGLGYERFQFNHVEIASLRKITLEEARERFRHIELNGPLDGSGVQIILHDDMATLTVPYSHDPQSSPRVFDEVWRCLAAMVEEGDLRVYDPQLDRALELEKDREIVTSAYDRVVRRIPDLVRNSRPNDADRKPWWKFW